MAPVPALRLGVEATVTTSTPAAVRGQFGRGGGGGVSVGLEPGRGMGGGMAAFGTGVWVGF